MKRTVTLPHDGTITYYDGDHIDSDDLRSIIDYIRSCGYIEKGRKHKRRYYNVISAFDIETTKLENINWHTEMSTMYRYFNIVFCWQFQIDDIWIFGRYIENYFTLIKLLADKLKGGFVIWIHNITYEYNNLADYFAGSEIFFRNKNQPVYIRNDMEYRCSAQLTHKSLKQLGESIGYEKLKDDFDYNVIRSEITPLSASELNYCYRDTNILVKYIKAETEAYTSAENRDCNSVYLPYTQTGYVRKDMRKHWSDTPEGYSTLQQTALELSEYLFINQSFYGGYVHTNFRRLCERITSKVRHMDIVSAYPAVMILKKYPYKLTESKMLSRSLYLKNLYREDFAQIASITFTNIMLKKGCVPYIPYSKEKCTCSGQIVENGKLVCADSLTITLNEIDMRLLIQNYDFDKDFKINRLMYGIKKRLPHNVIDTVLKYFNAKTTLKNVTGKEYEYGLGKQKLNSTYGMTAQGLIHDLFEVDENYDVVVTETEYKPAQVLPYQWSGYITAYVRDIIYGTISAMEDKNKYIYSDTDSIFYEDDEDVNRYIADYNASVRCELELLSNEYFNILPKNPMGVTQYLGTLADENDDCIEFCAIGAKRYYIKHSNGLYDVTFSGLSATKVIPATKKRKARNGYNTNRLIEIGRGDLFTAFKKIRDSSVHLPYVEGIDKLSNYNVRSDFAGYIGDRFYQRPCSFVLYPVSTSLSLNKDLFAFLDSDLSTELF